MRARRCGCPQPSVIAPPRSVLAIAEVATGAAPPVPAKGRATVTLARLAAAAGIAPEWWDIEGNRHAVEPGHHARPARRHAPAGGDRGRGARVAGAVRGDPSAPGAAAGAGRGRGRAAACCPLAVGTGRLVLEGEDGTQAPLDLGAAAEASVLCADGRSVRMRPVRLPSLPAGRWRLWPEGRPDLVCTLIVAPRTCFLPAAFAGGGRRFGLAAHLYSVRREGDQGIGDFTTLGLLGREAAQAGAAVLGLNPLHMLFPATRARASPYHPSDRRFLDPIHIDVAGEDGGLAAPAARARLAGEAGRLAALHAAPMVDYPGVWACKQAVLEAAFAAFDASDPDGAALAGFRAYGGAALAQFAAFQAIAERYPGDWRGWPAGLRAPDAPDVAAFTASHAARVRFHVWLQWLADRQLAAAAATAGLEIGFYRDLAVGCAPDGAEAWAGRRRWRPAPRSARRPTRSRARGRSGTCPRPIRGACARTGSPGSRACSGPTCATPGRSAIDHAMGLTPPVLGPGGRQRRGRRLCRLSAGGHARRAGAGKPAGALPGRRRGPRHGAGGVPRAARGGRRAELPRAVVRARRRRVPPAGSSIRRARSPASPPTTCRRSPAGGTAPISRSAPPSACSTPRRRGAATAERAAETAALAAAIGGEPTAEAVHGYLAAAPSALVLAQADDLGDETMALNLPGTDRERPNWRRKIATPVPALLQTPEARAIIGRLRPGRTA